MRVSIAKHDLAHLLGAVTKVVESRNTIPILSNVVLAVADGRLTTKATDLDIEAEASVAVLDAADGATTVEAKLLNDIVKRASGDLSLELDDQTLHVRSGRSRFKLQTLPVGDYPSLQHGGFDVEFDVDLAALVGPVQFAMSNEETRFYLNGVFLHAVGGFLTAVATDGHRLSRVRGDKAPDGLPSVILPRKLVSLLPKGGVHVSLSESKVRIVADGVTLTSKLIDGTFPDYERVIPKDNNNVATFDRDEMLTAADRVAVISSEKGRSVKLAVSADGINLTARGDGEAGDCVEAKLEGEPLEIGFNATYLLDMLQALKPGSVSLAMADSGSPAVVTAENVADWTGVLMPMRV